MKTVSCVTRTPSPFIGVLWDLTVTPGIKKILPDSITKYDGLRIVCPRRGMGSANRSTLFCL